MKIYITGPPGSGKTRLAHELSRRFAAPAYELDEIVWDNSEGFTGKKHPVAARDGKIAEMLRKQSWITEGFYFDEWMLPVLHAVDFVLILAPPKLVRSCWLIKRSMRSWFQFGPRKEGLGILITHLKMAHAFDRDKIPRMIDFLNREQVRHHLYSGNNSADYVMKELA